MMFIILCTFLHMNFRKLAIIRSTNHDRNYELGVRDVGRVVGIQDGHSAGYHLGKVFDLEYVAYWY